jgi:GMP reductase
MNKARSYSDITLMPRLGVVPSRSRCDPSVSFLGRTFKLPIVPANMRCSISFDKAVWLSENDYFYVLHRFYDYEDISEWVKNNQHLKTISISIGVNRRDIELVQIILERGDRIDFLTIDVAHGHSVMVKNTVTKLIEIFALYSGKTRLIVGNITSVEAVEDLIDWGVDAIKVGIGQGHVCTTRTQTGFGVPMASAVIACAQSAKALGVPIIADGGVSHYGDAAKAIALGASMVMVGSMFARCIDSPAEFAPRDHNYKRWYGSASEENKGEKKHIEGICRTEICNGLTYEEMLTEWKEALQSSISYAGGVTLECLKTLKPTNVINI